MALVIRNCWHLTNLVLTEKQDIRLEKWPLMGTPATVIGIVAIYILVSTSLGPRFMRDRPAYRLRSLINCYNLLQIGWNSYLAYYIFYSTLAQGDINLRCESSVIDDSSRQRHIAIATYLYFMAKVIDLMDTMFFVLCKKNDHVTFLHIYHHALMVLSTYIGVKFLPGGHSWLLGLLNSIVHVLMYTYYFLTSSNSKLISLTTWKKVLTQIQMGQFVILAVHYLVGFFHDCAYPKTAMLIGAIQNGFMFIMFSEFYYAHYVRAKK